MKHPFQYNLTFKRLIYSEVGLIVLATFGCAFFPGAAPGFLLALVPVIFAHFTGIVMFCWKSNLTSYYTGEMICYFSLGIALFNVMQALINGPMEEGSINAAVLLIYCGFPIALCFCIQLVCLITHLYRTKDFSEGFRKFWDFTDPNKNAKTRQEIKAAKKEARKKQS